MIKLLLRYERAFWLEGDFGAVGRTDAPSGLAVVDASDPEGGPELLAVFCGGSAATAMEGLSDHDLPARVFDAIEPMLGPAVRAPLTVLTNRWTDHPWVGGGHAPWATPWAHNDPWAPLRAAQGGLYFSVAELAEFPGFIEGACRRGREVAARILQSGGAGAVWALWRGLGPAVVVRMAVF